MFELVSHELICYSQRSFIKTKKLSGYAPGANGTLSDNLRFVRVVVVVVVNTLGGVKSFSAFLNRFCQNFYSYPRPALNNRAHINNIAL